MRHASVDGDDELPEYADALFAFHRACARPLRRIVDALPIEPGAHVLDTPCGDGTYLPWLAEKVGPAGRAVGVDANRAYLETARARVRASGRDNAEVMLAEMPDLPFEEGTFDFVWCAHSLYSLPDPLGAVRELRRVLRRGGRLGILENDSFHHWLLPWPVELELAVRQAQLEALEGQTRAWGKHYIGRHLATVLASAGFGGTRVVTQTIDHASPLSPDERRLVTSYLERLRTLTRDRLDPSMRKALDTFIDGQGPEPAAIDREDFVAAHLEIVAVARKT